MVCEARPGLKLPRLEVLLRCKIVGMTNPARSGLQ